MTGPEHYKEAESWATEAAEAFETDLLKASTLAAIAQVHANLAAAAALHEEPGDIRAWRQATGQEGR